MIEFQKRTLGNGLKVIVHEDNSTPLVAINLVYNVGARDEDPNKTGFAHLFEHLMFGGSKNIPDYDTQLQLVGGENNAFTTNDITNYYITLPPVNIETGLWLESDRMLELDFSEQSLNVQKNVVIEEFKQRTLNQPYGDVFSLIRDMAYTVHPYKWPTIGKEVSHIEQASLSEVKDFFYKHYAPNNAVICIAGNIKSEEAFTLVDKWFGDLPQRNVPKRNLPVEPRQEVSRSRTEYRDVPYDAIYLAFHTSDKLSDDYYVTDLISDVLSNGESSRLYHSLIIEQGLFSEIDAYITGDNDPGLFVVAGKLVEGVSIQQAEDAVWEQLQNIIDKPLSEGELQKVINKVEANLVYSEINYLNKAMSLASFELLGDADMVNRQTERYQKVTPEKFASVAKSMFRREGCSTLYYLRRK